MSPAEWRLLIVMTSPSGSAGLPPAGAVASEGLPVWMRIRFGHKKVRRLSPPDLSLCLF
jgi:hypothetical protein